MQEALLRLFVSSGGTRISSAILDGRKVWIKRYDVEPRPCPCGILAKLESMIEFFSPLLPLLGLLEKVSLGSDGRRVLKGTRYLKRFIARMGADASASNTARLATAERMKEGP